MWLKYNSLLVLIMDFYVLYMNDLRIVVIKIFRIIRKYYLFLLVYFRVLLVLSRIC